MTKTQIVDVAKTVGKYVLGAVLISAVAEGGYACGSMLANDVEFTAKTVDSKIVNPTGMAKRGMFKKPEPYNKRTGRFVSDGKPVPASKTTKK